MGVTLHLNTHPQRNRTIWFIASVVESCDSRFANKNKFSSITSWLFSVCRSSATAFTLPTVSAVRWLVGVAFPWFSHPKHSPAKSNPFRRVIGFWWRKWKPFTKPEHLEQPRFRSLRQHRESRDHQRKICETISRISHKARSPPPPPIASWHRNKPHGISKVTGGVATFMAVRNPWWYWSWWWWR